MAIENTEESASTEGEHQPVENSLLLEGLSKSFFPVLVLVLSVLYIQATWGELALLPNLTYPYFFIAASCVTIIAIMLFEIKELNQNEYEYTATEQLNRWWTESSQSILLSAVIVIYPILIRIVGFYIASGIITLMIMYIGDYRSWKRMVIVLVILLFGVYILFDIILGLQPPEGALGVGG